MRFSTALLTTTLLSLSQACYRTNGYIQQHINTCTQTTHYIPSIYLTKDNVQVCNGHFYEEEENVYNKDFIPGGLPTNSSFSGPFAAADCTVKSIQADIQGVNGQALIRDYETAFYISPENLNWQMIATGENLAGIDCVVGSLWSWDSGDVHC